MVVIPLVRQWDYMEILTQLVDYSILFGLHRYFTSSGWSILSLQAVVMLVHTVFLWRVLAYLVQYISNNPKSDGWQCQ